MGDATDPESLAAEVERLRAERDALADQAARLDRRVHGGRVRRTVVAVLVVASTLSFLVAGAGWWVNRNLLETDVWVERVGPLASDPAVQRALAAEISDQALQAIDPKALFESALPERGQVLAGPLAGAVDSFVRARVEDFVASDAFADLWVRLNETGHRDAVAVLRGESGSDLVDVGDGTVTVSIIPAIDAVLARIAEISPEIFGRTVTLPTLTVEDLPDAARAKIGQALGVTLDEDFGVITVYDGDALSTSQTALKVFDRLLVPAIVLTVLLVPLTLVVSRRRRRTALQLLAGWALVLVLLRRASLRLVGDVVDLAQIPGNRAALESILHAFADPLLSATAWILAVLAALAAVLVVTGPYPWVRALRRGVAGLARGTAGAARGAAGRLGEQGRQDAAVVWVRRHATALRVAGVVAVVVVLWWGDLSWLGLLVLAGLVGAWELWLGWLVTASEEDRTTAEDVPSTTS